MTTIELFALSAASTCLVVSIVSVLVKLFTGICEAIRGLPRKQKYFIYEILLSSVSLAYIIYLIAIK